MMGKSIEFYFVIRIEMKKKSIERKSEIKCLFLHFRVKEVPLDLLEREAAEDHGFVILHLLLQNTVVDIFSTSSVIFFFLVLRFCSLQF